MSSFFVTCKCGCREEVRVNGAFGDDPEGLARYMRERAESAAERLCRNCHADESIRWARSIERRLSLPPLHACGSMGRSDFAIARTRRARVCSELDDMSLGAFDRAAIQAFLSSEQNAAFWRTGCAIDPGRLLRHARGVFLTVEESSRALGVSEQRVRKMLADGALEGSKSGAGWLVSGASVEARRRAGRRTRL